MTNHSGLGVVIKGGAAMVAVAAGAAKAQDLQGLYGGLSYTRGAGEIVDGNDVYTFDGNAGGAFVGYNHVVGDWLFGAEIAFPNGEYMALEASDSPFIQAENVRDLKARVGRLFGRTLVYGVVGRTDLDFTVGNSPGETAGASATAIGLGFEAPIGNKGFFGGEYLVRKDLSFDGGDAASYAEDGSELNTLSLRMGLRF